MFVAKPTLWNRSAVGAAYRKESTSVEESKQFQKVAKKKPPIDNLSNNLRRKILDVTVDPRPKFAREFQAAEQLLLFTKEAIGEVKGLLNTMQAQADLYYEQGASDQDKYEAKLVYDEAALEIQDVVNTASYEDKYVLQDSSGDGLFSQPVSPLRYRSEFSVEFGPDLIVDASGLDITLGETVVDAALLEQSTRAEKFTSKLQAYIQGVSSQVEMIVNSTQFYDKNIDILTESEAGDIAALSKRWVNEDSAKFFGSSRVPPRDSVMALFNFDTETGGDKESEEKEP